MDERGIIEERRVACHFHEEKMQQYEKDLKEMKNLLTAVDKEYRLEQRQHESAVAKQLERVIQQNIEQNSILTRFDSLIENMRESNSDQKVINNQFVSTLKEMSNSLTEQRFEIHKLEGATVEIKKEQETAKSEQIKIKESLDTQSKRGWINMSKLRDEAIEKIILGLFIAGFTSIIVFLVMTGLWGG